MFQLKDGIEEEVHDHSISAIIIVGTTPAKKVERRSFEQYRNCLRDVRIVTFDELEQRLVDVHKALSAESSHSPYSNQHDSPF
ncbi:Shedu anti-phage system protein SduA domain-containing protein (plasmid) [Pseudomonas mandelii]|uniref:Shedu anti-phage system protein SduA domain-containing protein n=1 Tax=Pseudomonas mandelii TaxID=75612 RepID=UPI00398D3D0C